MINKIKNAIIKAFENQNFAFDPTKIIVSKSKHLGDFSTNAAFLFAKNNNMPAMEFAQKIVDFIDKNEIFATKIEVATPGFINFYISNQGLAEIVKKIIDQDLNYGSQNQNQKINVEFVSANPTGFLHLGHLRSAVIGDVLSNILKFSGNQVLKEYYINDFGVQIDRLANSTIARYQQLFNPNFSMPEDAYNGEDIIWAAKQIKAQIGDKFANKPIDDEQYHFFRQESLSIFLKEIKSDLANLGICFDKYSSEADLHKNALFLKTITNLPGTYTKENALWLKTSEFGDDKDRVLIKSDNKLTYFGADIFYHLEKINSNFKPDILINVWGADHIGYLARMQSALKILGYPEKLKVLLYQIVSLLKNGSEFKMSKRKGSTFTIKELANLVDVDSLRFFMVERSENSLIEFDIDKAANVGEQNPLFLIQYAHARSAQLLSKAKLNIDKITNFESNYEIKLINDLKEFEEIIAKISKNYKINLLNKYLLTLANSFNAFYSNCKILESPNQDSLLSLVKATNIVIKIGLGLLGIQAKERI